ncbi:hypothetical protein CaCOL14_008860 [Colletotrichum acutatum]|uniref:Uncharacterized protein n=1 Tax=Glomerella acutata TaxID=27357 RepID=A0AAD8X9C4_GLOAC|nr:uncharacterized protein BDZ83DRAFT_757499 [Colletotrichum acutatum]KAK1710603.1 hypothetical protein BDZ83DRAFT_757499 [Colletotrichum acutatum]
MEYHVFKQVIQTVLIAIFVLLGVMVLVEKIPASIGNNTARQAAKKIQGLEQEVANLMAEVEDAKESKERIAKLTEEREAANHKIAELTKKLEAAEEKSQALTDALYVEAKAAEKSQLEIVDLMNELDAARNFGAITLNAAFQINQEAREKTQQLYAAAPEQVRKFSNFGLQNWSGAMKDIQECIKLDYGRIKLLDEATAVEHAMQASLDEMDEAAKKNAPPSATSSA